MLPACAKEHKTLVSKTEELIQSERSTQTEQLSRLLFSMKELANSLHESRIGSSSLQETLLGMEHSDILRWISTSVDPSRNYNQAINDRQKGTGEWLIRSDGFMASVGPTPTDPLLAVFDKPL